MNKIVSIVLILAVSCQLLLAQKPDKKQSNWVEKTLRSLTLREKIAAAKAGD